MSDILKNQIDDLEDFLKELEKEAKRLQAILYEQIIEGVFDKFEIDNTFKLTEKNYFAVGAIDKIVDKFSTKYEKKVLRDIADKIIEQIQVNKDYFASVNVSKSLLNRGAVRAGIIEARLGLKDGKVVAGGWIDSLSQNTIVKDKIKNFVTDAITNETNVGNFTRGLKNLVRGTPEAQGIKEQYFRQNVHDAIFQSDRFIKKQFAEEAGMTNFIYFGGVIKTTRPFCRARDGKVFTLEEAESWKVMDWAGKSEPYDPLVDMGGYNCRHSPQFISDDMAKELTNE